MGSRYLYRVVFTYLEGSRLFVNIEFCDGVLIFWMGGGLLGHVPVQEVAWSVIVPESCNG